MRRPGALPASGGAVRALSGGDQAFDLRLFGLVCVPPLSCKTRSVCQPWLSPTSQVPLPKG